jgi:hypothetical protein
LVPIGIYVKNVIPDENPASSFKVDGFWKITFQRFSLLEGSVYTGLVTFERFGYFIWLTPTKLPACENSGITNY